MVTMELPTIISITHAYPFPYLVGSTSALPMLVPEFPGSLLKHHRVMLKYFPTTLKTAIKQQLVYLSTQVAQCFAKYRYTKRRAKGWRRDRQGEKPSNKCLGGSLLLYFSTRHNEQFMWRSIQLRKKENVSLIFYNHGHILDFLLTTELLKSRTKTTAFLQPPNAFAFSTSESNSISFPKLSIQARKKVEERKVCVSDT